MKILFRTESWFLLFGLLYFTFCILVRQNTFDLNIHDTFLVLDFLTLGTTTLIYHLFFSVIYFFIRKHSLKSLGIIHFLGTIFFTVHVFSMTGVPRRYYESSVDEPLLTSSTAIISLFVLGQIIFVFNLVFSIIKMRRMSRSHE